MAFWLIYYEPAYKGRIVDAETKEPIEGAVVAAIYYSHTIIGGPAGGWSTVINTKEAMTDEKGEFYISPYLTLFNPFMHKDGTKFIIYKPGYKGNPAIDDIDYFRPYAEDFFTKEIGEKGEKRVWDKTYTVTYGIVELLRCKTEKRDERLKAMPGRPMGTGADELPLLFKALNEENRRFGRGEVK